MFIPAFIVGGSDPVPGNPNAWRDRHAAQKSPAAKSSAWMEEYQAREEREEMMVTKQIKIADDLMLPMRAVTEMFAFLGSRGAAGFVFGVIMKAITLHQPWATLVALGEKKIETRSWSTSYRGPLAIHASKNAKYIKGKESLLLDITFLNALWGAVDRWKTGMFPLGYVVATCNLVHVREMDEAIVFSACRSFGYKGKEWSLDRKERAFGFYSVGRFMWLLDDIQIFREPVHVKGALGLWEWER